MDICRHRRTHEQQQNGEPVSFEDDMENEGEGLESLEESPSPEHAYLSTGNHLSISHTTPTMSHNALANMPSMHTHNGMNGTMSMGQPQHLLAAHNF